MNRTEAICIFIKGALVKQKHDRYIGFVRRAKGQNKFLKELDHSIEKVVDKSKVKAKLTDSELNECGYIFTSNGVFGESVNNIKSAYDSAPWDGGWLIISENDLFGILRPEGRMDNELYIRL